jgi:cell division protein FtsQ
MRRVKPWLMNGCALAVLAGATVWVVRDLPPHVQLTSIQDHAAESLSTVGLSVEEVLVTGRVKTDPADLLDALGAVRGTPILDLDIPAARQRINALPWVKSSEVVRRLPNSISITLHERTAFAVWQRDGRYTLVDRDGETIVDIAAAEQPLPVIVGNDAPRHAAALFDALAEQPALNKKVTAAVRFGSRRWDVVFGDIEDGVIVKLPETGISEAWSYLALLDANHQLLSRAVAIIDLRVAGRTFVTLKDGYTINNQHLGPKQEAARPLRFALIEEYNKGV